MLIFIIIGCYGLLIGSFLNAWIWRLHTGRKVSRGRSMCPKCKTTLKWYELIPVFSWLGLQGKCRTCRKSISVQYPLVELVTSGLWGSLFIAIHPANLQSWLELGVWLVVASLLIAAFVFDAKWMLLPDHFMIPAIGVAALWLLVRWVFFAGGAVTADQLIGAAIFGGVFFLIWYLSGGALLGDGDIRLAILMGLLLSPSQLIIAIFMAFNLGAIVGVVLIALKQKTRRDPIAFGPFLIIGLFIGYFWADKIIAAYFHLLT